MPEPCDRKRCPGQFEEWAVEQRADGTTWRWLVCTVDTRHTVERDTAPQAGERQVSLFEGGPTDG